MRVRALLLAMLFGFGCAAVSDVLRNGVQKPKLTFQDAKLDTIDLESATIAATFKVDNPNPFGLSVAGVDYGVTLDSQKLFDGNLSQGLDLPPSGSTTLSVPVRIPFKAVPGLLTTVVTKTEAPYEVAGQVTVHTPISDLTVPLSFHGMLPIPSLPKLHITAAHLDSLSLTGARVVLTVAVDNPNVFPVPLDELSANLLVGDQAVGQVGLKAPQPLASKQVTSVELPVSISFSNAGLAVSRALATRSAVLKLQGDAKMGGQEIPVNLSGALQ